MVLFLSILGWSLLESFGLVRRAGLMYNLHNKGGPTAGASTASPMPKSVSISREGKKSTVDGL